ncbi:PIG-L deacetylase family protein [Nocardia iowensis]|uniref:PIG-L family deacetylase n=1 Tax=Nocardia iowensis TaxID=204891 RepID=A0ABX8RPE2_NOCIO|nr:PIG-L deacetylase family protein [Nocardia iowensis]QXN90155.1 PIG-L family deacetylase [Nocardia iowensis]
MVAEPLTDLVARGTPERIWTRWRHRRPELSLTGWRHLIVVAPHPDDEVLGVGGLIALARSRDLPVTVVTVTDGEASHPGSPTCSPTQLADVRVAESRRAAQELGAEAPIRLGFRDGRVATDEAAVTAALCDILTECGHTGAWCATTWRRDGHPDHEAVGRAAAAACAGTATRLLEFPVWMWHWATPEHPVVPASRARTLTLPGAAVDAKLRAIAQFRSQILPMSEDPADQPILPPEALDRFTGASETFFV